MKTNPRQTLIDRTARPIDPEDLDDDSLAAYLKQLGRDLAQIERRQPSPYRPGRRRNSHRWSQRCKARAKSTGEQCKKWAMANRSTCRAHGGASYRAEALADLDKTRLIAWVRAASLVKMQYDALLRIWRWRRFSNAFEEGRHFDGILSGSEDAALQL